MFGNKGEGLLQACISSIVLMMHYIGALICTIFERKAVTISARNTIMRKLVNIVRQYLPHITTFFNQILEFERFFPAIPGISFFHLDLSGSKISL